MGGRRRAAVGVPLGVAVLAACGVAYRKSLSPSAAAASLLAAAPGGASFRQAALDASGDALEMECSNEDTAHYGQPGRGYPWLTVGHLVEPHRETTITLVGGAAMAVEAVDWTVAQTTNIAEHKGAQRVRTPLNVCTPHPPPPRGSSRQDAAFGVRLHLVRPMFCPRLAAHRPARAPPRSSLPPSAR